MKWQLNLSIFTEYYQRHFYASHRTFYIIRIYSSLLLYSEERIFEKSEWFFCFSELCLTLYARAAPKGVVSHENPGKICMLYSHVYASNRGGRARSPPPLCRRHWLQIAVNYFLHIISLFWWIFVMIYITYIKILVRGISHAHRYIGWWWLQATSGPKVVIHMHSCLQNY